MKLKMAVVLAVTAGCLAWVLAGIDLSVVQVSLGDANWWTLVPVISVYLVNHCIRSIRLRVLLNRPDIPFKAMFSIITLGFLAINVVPLRLGEFVRPYLLMERHDVPFGQSIAAVFLERLLDLLCLLGMLLMVAWWVDLPPDSFVVGDLDVMSAGQKVVGTGSAVGISGLVVLFIVGKPIVDLVTRFSPRLGGFVGAFDTGLRDLVKRPGAALFCLTLSLVMWTGVVTAVYTLMAGFEGVPATAQAALTTWTMTITGMTLAPTPGFWGSYEAFCLAALLIFDVERSVGTTFAVVLHLTQFGFIVGLGSSYLLAEGVSLTGLVSKSREAVSG
jgi:glycosyltransferase 2 family protein